MRATNASWRQVTVAGGLTGLHQRWQLRPTIRMGVRRLPKGVAMRWSERARSLMRNGCVLDKMLSLVRGIAVLVLPLIVGHFDNGACRLQDWLSVVQGSCATCCGWSRWVVMWVYRDGWFASKGRRRRGVRTKSSEGHLEAREPKWGRARLSRQAIFISGSEEAGSEEERQTVGRGRCYYCCCCCCRVA